MPSNLSIIRDACIVYICCVENLRLRCLDSVVRIREHLKIHVVLQSGINIAAAYLLLIV